MKKPARFFIDSKERGKLKLYRRRAGRWQSVASDCAGKSNCRASANFMKTVENPSIVRNCFLLSNI